MAPKKFLARVAGRVKQSNFAEAVREAVLTGLSTITSTAVEATDTLLAAVGKLQAQISALAQNKQDTLVSGENIKTINNETILGTGNIVITGSGTGVVAVVSRQNYSGVETDGVDTFNINYTVPNLQVFVNGKLIPPDNYIATNGTSVTLSQPLTVDDVIDLLGTEIQEGTAVKLVDTSTSVTGEALFYDTNNVITRNIQQSDVAGLVDALQSAQINRTISTNAPTGVPVDGQEWIVI